jgi:MoaA/NifB/PqqE/SkfB family radical SAM enzyme
MTDKIYQILPTPLKLASVNLHRGFRQLLFKIKNTKIQSDIFLDFNLSRKYGPLNKICYAPYTSMFFSRSGYVSPCYASYNEKSPTLLDYSLKEIWTQGFFKDIRGQHACGDLESNCVFCKQLMDNRNFGSLLINKYEHYAFSKKDYPIIMEFELSNKCNLSCIMCDSNLSSTIAGKECEDNIENEFYGESFFKQLEEFIPHLQLAEFTGGDPFLIEEYYRIWDMISIINPNCQILITTNANTMNAEIEKLLEKNKNIHFNVSIDSLQKENYEKIRIYGNLEKALKNIDRFISYTQNNKTSLNLLVCPLTINRHELHNFVNFANEKDICVYYHTVIKPKNLSLKYIDKTSLIETINELKKHSFPSKTQKQKTNLQNFNNLVSLLETWAEFNEKKEDGLINDCLQTKEEILEMLNQKIFDNCPEQSVKFNKIISYLASNLADKDFSIILKRLKNTNTENFITNIEEKQSEELIEICKSFIKK